MTIERKFPWVVDVEGKVIEYDGRRWRFERGVPRPVGAADPRAHALDRWASVRDASRLFELREALIRRRVRSFECRAKRFDGGGARGSPVLYVNLDDVARIVPARARRRVKSVRAEPVVGAVIFRDGQPVPVRAKRRKQR